MVVDDRWESPAGGRPSSDADNDVRERLLLSSLFVVNESQDTASGGWSLKEGVGIRFQMSLASRGMGASPDVSDMCRVVFIPEPESDHVRAACLAAWAFECTMGEGNHWAIHDVNL